MSTLTECVVNTLTQRTSEVSAYVAEGKLDHEPCQVRASYRTSGISINTGLSSLYLSLAATRELVAHLQAAANHLEQIIAARPAQEADA